MRLIWKSIHRVLWILLAVPILLLPMLTRMAWATGGETPEFRRAGADGAVTVRILGAEGDWEADAETQAQFAADEAAKVDAAWETIFGSAENSIVLTEDNGSGGLMG